MIWTAISFNWSNSLTSVYTFLSSHNRKEAIAKFKDEYIGEVILALIAGDHCSKTSTYPLTAPGINKQQAENNND
jgi:hypothetical protein